MRILKTTFPVSDIGSSVSFFREVLDLEIDGTSIKVGWSRIQLIAGNRVLSGSLHLAFNVSYEQFDEAADWLRQRTALQRDRDGLDCFVLEGYWQSKSIYFDGPDGSILELIGRRRRNGPPSKTPFKGSDLICVSEIGLPTDNVEMLVSDSTRVFGLTTLAPPSNKFAAIGDGDGLLIAVDGNRPWFPEERHLPNAQGIEVIVDCVNPGGMIENPKYGWKVTAL